jgi:hypothetical protein
MNTPGYTGGSTTVPTATANFSVSTNTSSATISLAQYPNHTHTALVRGGSGTTLYNLNSNMVDKVVRNVGPAATTYMNTTTSNTSASHNHTGTNAITGASVPAFSNVTPPYYTLAFIMKA